MHEIKWSQIKLPLKSEVIFNGTPHSPYKKSKSLISGGLSFGSTVL